VAILSNKVAFVTGAASGFGAGIARAFVAEGAKVALLDINLEPAQALQKEFGTNTVAVRCDVSSGSSVRDAVAVAATVLGEPDIIVNNAGITHKNQPVMEVDEATFDRVYAVNVKSIYNMTMATLPLMRKKKGGSIINVGSTAGIRPRPGLVWYNGSKAAVNSLSKSLAVELAPDNIRVNCICPVMGETGLLESFMGMPDTPENRKKFLGTIPLGRLSRPADIAAAAVFFASEPASFLTGVEMPVDGGRTI
jgi:3-oxoacyl-[acyl-carrier protein] reductase